MFLFIIAKYSEKPKRSFSCIWIYNYIRLTNVICKSYTEIEENTHRLNFNGSVWLMNCIYFTAQSILQMQCTSMFSQYKYFFLSVCEPSNSMNLKRKSIKSYIGWEQWLRRSSFHATRDVFFLHSIHFLMFSLRTTNSKQCTIWLLWSEKILHRLHNQL